MESKGRTTGMASIFELGFREFARLRQQGQVPVDQLLEGARRSMRVAQLKEIDRLEHSLSTLATVGSTSPYVGLFGTVWGIMSAFASLGNAQQATLAMVAPGISEALITTAIGLFAAIPAVIAFNRFADQVGRLEVRYDAFTEEFSSILQRHAAPQARRGGLRYGPSVVPRAAAHGRDQCRAVHRCHAGAAHHFHGDRTAVDAGREGRSAQGQLRTPHGGSAPEQQPAGAVH